MSHRQLWQHDVLVCPHTCERPVASPLSPGLSASESAELKAQGRALSHVLSSNSLTVPRRHCHFILDPRETSALHPITQLESAEPIFKAGHR